MATIADAVRVTSFELKTWQVSNKEQPRFPPVIPGQDVSILARQQGATHEQHETPERLG